MMNLEEMLNTAHKRMQAITNDPPQCPKCDEVMQVQIMNWLDTPMEWRCRICLHPFTYQPQAPSDPKNFWARITGWLH